jgi:hypothetical protein
MVITGEYKETACNKVTAVPPILSGVADGID